MSKKNQVNDFTLEKVKRYNEGGLEVAYRSSVKEGQQIFNDSHVDKCTKHQHPDLDQALNKLENFLFDSVGIGWVEALSKSTQLNKEEKKAFDLLQSVINGAMKQLYEKLKITGISVSGKSAEKRNVVITGTMQCTNKKIIALNSPLIALNGKAFGWEVELMEIVDEIAEEVEAYLFSNKKAQMDLFAPEATPAAGELVLNPESDGNQA